MKRVIFTCFYLMLTLVLSAAGFFLPASLSAYQDQQIFATIEHPSIEPMELTYSSSLLDTLQLFSRGYYFVEYPRTGSERTSEEVYELVKDILKQLDDFGITIFRFEDSISNYSISLQLAIASEEEPENAQTDISFPVTDANPSDGKKTLFSWPTETEENKSTSHSSTETDSTLSDVTTAVIWDCFINTENGFWADIKIDDKSGKIIAFRLSSDIAYFSTQTKTKLNGQVKLFAAFLEDYYEMQAKPILQNMVQSAYNNIDGTPAILEADYIIQLKEESGNLIQLPLTMREGYLVMNYVIG